jgi:hypothetical protein
MRMSEYVMGPRMSIEQVEKRLRNAILEFIFMRGGELVAESFGVRVDAGSDGKIFWRTREPAKCCALGAWVAVEQPSPGWCEADCFFDEDGGDEVEHPDEIETDEEQATVNAARHIFGWSSDEHAAFMAAFDGWPDRDESARFPEIVTLGLQLRRDYVHGATMPAIGP